MEDFMREVQTFMRSDLGQFVAFVLAAGFFLIVVGLLFKRTNMSVRAMTYAGLCLSIAFILSNFRIIQMGYGGSSTPMSMFFVTLVGFFFGPAIGIVSGVAYGFLQLVQRASIIHPMQLLLDYPMAFGMLGLSGFFWKIKGGLYIGFVVAVIGRWLIHTIAGWLYWIGFATPGSLWASIVYNSTYIIPEMVLTLVIIAIPPVRNALNHVKRRIAEDGL